MIAMASGNTTYEVLWPRGRRTVLESGYAPRPESLEGKTIAELWNWAFRGDEIFPVLEKELAGRYPGVRFVSYKNFGNIHGGDEREVLAALPGLFKKYDVDAVITAMDC